MKLSMYTVSLKKKYPLQILACLNCGLSFLSITVNPNIIFKQYDYLSSSSSALKNHYLKLTKNLSKKFKLKDTDNIIDIGCNDGILLNTYDHNYKNLIEYFPENTKEGFKTEALPAIWENKEEFNNLMNKSANDMIELASIIENSEDSKASLRKLMWGNCKTCHSKFRAEH